MKAARLIWIPRERAGSAHRARHHARAGLQLVLVDDVAELFDRSGRIAPDVVERDAAAVFLVADVEDGVVGELHGEVVPHARERAEEPPAWMPGGSASPTRRTPQEPSARAHQRSAVAVKRSSPTRSQPCQQPVCASRLVSEEDAALAADELRVLLHRRIAPRHSRSQAMPCSSSRKRKRFSGSSTSTLKGPTGRSACGRRAAATRAPRGSWRRAARARRRILGGQVRVLAQPVHHEQLVGAGEK